MPILCLFLESDTVYICEMCFYFDINESQVDQDAVVNWGKLEKTRTGTSRKAFEDKSAAGTTGSNNCMASEFVLHQFQFFF